MEIDVPQAASQQASYLGRSDYITAHVDIDEDDVTSYKDLAAGLCTSPLHNFEAKIRRIASWLEIPKGTMRQSLLRNFLLRCRPWMPLISERGLGSLDAKTKDTLLITRCSSLEALHVLCLVALMILFRHNNKDEPPPLIVLLASSFISGTLWTISHIKLSRIYRSRKSSSPPRLSC